MRHCFVCEDREAVYPTDDPTFCSAGCVGVYAYLAVHFDGWTWNADTQLWEGGTSHLDDVVEPTDHRDPPPPRRGKW